jgi:hypothetical protein
VTSPLGGPHVCEAPRLPYLLDNWLTDGGEVVSYRRRQTAPYPAGRFPTFVPL